MPVQPRYRGGNTCRATLAQRGTTVSGSVLPASCLLDEPVLHFQVSSDGPLGLSTTGHTV